VTRLLLALCLAATCAGCGDDTPTSPTSALTLTTESFTGTLTVNGQRFYAFNAPSGSAVSVLLANLRTADTPALPSTAVGLGVGIPAGTGCAVANSVVTTPALTSQFQASVDSGIHCVAIFDTGALTEAVSFAIRFSHF